MTIPNLPARKVPGWLYAVLFAITVGGYVALVTTNHSGDTSSLLLVATPILSSVFVADRVSATTKNEGETTRTAITNGSLTTGLLNALEHPEVIAKVTTLVQDAAHAVDKNIPVAVDSPPAAPAAPIPPATP